LATYEIWIPSLRERRDDMGRLLVRFLREELETIGEAHRLDPPPPEEKPWLPSSLVARLADYDWPGNVRKLRNVARQLIIGNRGRKRLEITAAVERLLSGHELSDAPPAGEAPPLEPATMEEARVAPAAATASSDADNAAGSDSPARRSAARKPADVTEPELREALRASGWELEATAQKLGISRASTYNLCKRYQVRMAGDLAEEEIIRCHRECGGDVAAMAERLEVSERALGRRVREIGLE
jgi:two-component system nitrogen regulation response regulator GlnG